MSCLSYSFSYCCENFPSLLW